MLRKHSITSFFVFYFSVYSASIVTANSIEAEESDQQQATDVVLRRRVSASLKLTKLELNENSGGEGNGVAFRVVPGGNLLTSVKEFAFANGKCVYKGGLVSDNGRIRRANANDWARVGRYRAKLVEYADTMRHQMLNQMRQSEGGSGILGPMAPAAAAIDFNITMEIAPPLLLSSSSSRQHQPRQQQPMHAQHHTKHAAGGRSMEPIVPPPVPTAGGDGLAAVPPSPPCLCLKCVNEV